jgi:GTP diphosphokinase / guanosine-3',5'-bis(diphosphate) 3'-diphosphatase
VQAVYPDLVPDVTDQIDKHRAVIGLDVGQNFDRAPCCQPLPGERIVGITFRGKGVVIHAIDCDRLTEYEDQPNRWLDLHWHSGSHPPIYTATLDLTISNDAGVLGRICTLIGEQKANISNLEFLDRKPDFYRLLIYVELRDVEHLHSVMLALEAESHVAAIERFRDPAAVQAPAEQDK